MTRKVLIYLIIFMVLALSTTPALAINAVYTNGTGLVNVSYKDTAHIFDVSAWDWCMDKIGNEEWCEGYLWQFATLTNQGATGGVPEWFAPAQPGGYGFFGSP